jgi:MFS family permease
LIFALGCGIGAVATLGFSFLARDLTTATLFWALAGVSLAGVYMPGLRVILDRIDGSLRLRAVPYYTASFGIGISLSFLASGAIAQTLGWRASFAAAAGGCVAALLCLSVATTRTTKAAPPSGSGAFDLRTVLRNRRALRYIVAYGGHCWELFALRAWLVALLFFVWNRDGHGPPGQTLTYWSSSIALAGVPSSIVGAEFALRLGRPQLVLVAASASIAVAVALATFAMNLFILTAAGLVLYNIAITGDSGAITAGVVDAADATAQGSTLALHSLVGFAGGALGPIAVGAALGLGGGMTSQPAWSIALIVMAAGSALAALAVTGVRRSAPASSS